MEALASPGRPAGVDLMPSKTPDPGTPNLPSAFGWGRIGSVLSWLFTEPWQFDFFQAIRLLEIAKPDAFPPGETSDPSVELVHLAANNSLATPASEIHSLEAPPEPGTPPLLRANFSSLGGAAGPLPYPVSSEARQTGLAQRPPPAQAPLVMQRNAKIKVLAPPEAAAAALTGMPSVYRVAPGPGATIIVTYGGAEQELSLVVRALVMGGIPVAGVEPERNELERIFLEVTKGEVQ